MSVQALLHNTNPASRTISTTSSLHATEDWLAGMSGDGSSSKSLQGFAAGMTRAVPALMPGQLKLDFNELVFIGQGATGLVYRGTALGAAPRGDGNWDCSPTAAVTVAVKFMICNTPRQLWQRAKEALLSKLVSHPNLVRTLAMDVTLVTPNTYREWGQQRPNPSADGALPSPGATGTDAGLDSNTSGVACISASAASSNPMYDASVRDRPAQPASLRSSEGLPPGTSSLPAARANGGTGDGAHGPGPIRSGPALSHPMVERLRAPGLAHPPSRQRLPQDCASEASTASGAGGAADVGGVASIAHVTPRQPQQQSWPGPDGYPTDHRTSNLEVKALSSPWTTGDGAGEDSHGHTGDDIRLSLSASGLTVGASMEANAQLAAGSTQGGQQGAQQAQLRQRRRKRALLAVTASQSSSVPVLDSQGSLGPAAAVGAAHAGPASPAAAPVATAASAGPVAAAAAPGGTAFGTPVDMALLHAGRGASELADRQTAGGASSMRSNGPGTGSFLSPLLVAAGTGGPDSRDEPLAPLGAVRGGGVRAAGSGGDGEPGSRSKEQVPFQDILYHLDALPGRFMAKVIMEYCDSGTLLQRINAGDFNTHPDRGPLAMLASMRAMLWCLQQVVDGMEHLHSLNIIHGDLKPANVLLASQPGSPLGYVSKVSDFGLATALEASEQTITHENWGTVLYMAPESCAGRCRKASDVYSFGVLLWQMVTGERPYAGLQAGQVLLGVKTGSLQLAWPPWVNKSLAKVGQACLRFAPKERPGFKGIRSALVKIGARLDQKIAVVESASMHGSRMLGGPSTDNVTRLAVTAAGLVEGGAEEEGGAQVETREQTGDGGGGGVGEAE